MYTQRINDFTEVRTCIYKNRRYSVRDNGAVMRHSKEDGHEGKFDNVWTFGTSINEKGYPCIASEVIHRIVATAFLGEAPSKSHVVDHINTNRQDNRPSNLRWVTRLENILLNPITCKRIENLIGKKIEEILPNIEILHNYDLPPNISWMRAVSQKESDICLENLNKWAKSDAATTKSPYKGKLGEWIYRSRKDIFNYEYPGSFEKEDGEKPTIFLSLTANAAQDKTRWRMPSEFPCCPLEITDKPLEDYLNRLQPGKVFCKSREYTSSVLEAAIHEDTLIVKTENINEDAIKPWAIAVISFENNLYVHRTYRTCFHKESADKYFTLLQGKAWSGGDVPDDFC